MPRLVVTGGAGFLGSHLCDRLLARGDDVVCVDNLVTGGRGNVGHLEGREGFQLRILDVSRPWDVDGPVDGVLNLASPASPIDYARLPLATLDAGTFGTVHALKLAAGKTARFLQASTSEVYGDPQVHRQSETYWGNVNPVGPRSVYDEAKRVGETYTMAFHRELGLDTRIARIFNTYGPRMRKHDGRAIPSFLTSALGGDPLIVFGDGSQTRSPCYVDDLIDGIVRLWDSDCIEPVNLGNPDELSILSLANIVIDVTGSRSTIEHRPLPQDDPLRRRPDISRARSMLGWEPRTPLREGLRRTAATWSALPTAAVPGR